MHPLLAILARWPGRPETKRLLQTKGYWLPDRYREIILTNCNGLGLSNLDLYWDEVALEYLCSAGRVRSDERIFSDETSYRSAYLDSLASCAQISATGEPVISLHEGLQALYVEAKKPGNQL